MPIVLGGIEASLRRLTHYDYWQDRLRPSILCDAPADIISYGMGEKTIVALADLLAAGTPMADITDLPQTVILRLPTTFPVGWGLPTLCCTATRSVWPASGPRPRTTATSRSSRT